MNNPFKNFIFIMLLLSTILTLGLAYIFKVFIIDAAEEEWNLECKLKGLPEKCTPIDECKKDCVVLGKEYFKNGDCGWACLNCWCLDGNKSVQIW